MPIVPSLNSFSAGTTAVASQVNSNFTNIRDTINTYAVLNDVANTIAVTHNWNATQTFTPAASYAINVVQGGINITAGGLTVASGNVALTAGNLTFGAASAKIVPGATSFLIRNNADSASNIAITDAGAVTVRAGLTVTAGGATITAGGLTVSAGATSVQAFTCTSFTTAAISATSTTIKLVSGSTDIQFRNNADTGTTLLYTDSGPYFKVGSTTVLTDFGLPAHGATTDTKGFLHLPTSPGAQTGVPAINLGAPIIYDVTTNKIYVYNFSSASWKSTPALT